MNHAKAILARHGICSELISDNGPSYIPEKFQRFAKDWDFIHITGSPYYPQCHGLANKFVHIAKQILTKVYEDSQDFYFGLLSYRNTPMESAALPAQMPMSRRLKSVTHAKESLLMS